MNAERQSAFEGILSNFANGSHNKWHAMNILQFLIAANWKGPRNICRREKGLSYIIIGNLCSSLNKDRHCSKISLPPHFILLLRLCALDPLITALFIYFYCSLQHLNPFYYVFTLCITSIFFCAFLRANLLGIVNQ